MKTAVVYAILWLQCETVFGQSAPTASPASGDYPSALFWLTADSLSILRGNDTLSSGNSTTTGDGGDGGDSSVLWRDLSGRGHDFRADNPASVAVEPWRNGQQAVLFDGVSRFRAPLHDIDDFQTITAIFVYQLVAPAKDFSTLMYQASDETDNDRVSGSTVYCGFNSDNTQYRFSMGDTSIYAGSSVDAYSGHVVTYARSSDGGYEVFEDGLAVSSGSQCYPDSHTASSDVDYDMVIGGRDTRDSFQFSGYLAEVIVFSEYLTWGRRTELEKSLLHKYSLGRHPCEGTDVTCGGRCGEPCPDAAFCEVDTDCMSCECNYVSRKCVGDDPGAGGILSCWKGACGTSLTCQDGYSASTDFNDVQCLAAPTEGSMSAEGVGSNPVSDEDILTAGRPWDGKTFAGLSLAVFCVTMVTYGALYVSRRKERLRIEHAMREAHGEGSDNGADDADHGVGGVGGEASDGGKVKSSFWRNSEDLSPRAEDKPLGTLEKLKRSFSMSGYSKVSTEDEYGMVDLQDVLQEDDADDALFL